MTFLNALLLGFTALGAIPIIIHLLNKSRFRVVEWGAMEFLLATMRQNSRRLQLRDVILLILRTLAIVLIALALARPAFAPGKLSFLGSASAVNAVVVLDHSRSMAYAEGAESRFAIAQRKAAEVLSALPQGSAVGLVLMSAAPTTVVAEPNRDLAYVADEVRRAAVSDGGSDVPAALTAAWAILKDRPGQREIHLVTDVQAVGWPAADAPAWSRLAAELRAAGDTRVVVIDTGGGGDNAAVTSLASDDELVSAQQEVVFTVGVAAFGRAATDLPVELWSDDGQGGALRKVASRSIDRLEGTTTIDLATRFPAGGTFKVEARIAPDRLEADDRRALVVKVQEKSRVLLIDGGAPGFAGGGAFIRAALAPGVQDAPAAGRALQIDTVSPRALDGRTLDDYQAVIINDVAELPPAVVEGLKSFVAPGRGLVIFPGPNVKGDTWTRTLYEQGGLLPAQLPGSPEDLPGTPADPGLGFSTAELVHPVVSFFAPRERQPFLATPRLRRAFPLEVPAPAPGEAPLATVVARLADGRPIIAERRIGRGTVLLFGAAADRSWSDLPLRPAFVMLVRRAVQQAALGGGERRNLGVHDRLVGVLPARAAGEQVRVDDPRGGTARMAATLTPAGDAAVVEVPDTVFAGFWTLTSQAGRQIFALSGPGDEADLTAIDLRELLRQQPDLPLAMVGAADGVAAGLQEVRQGKELWPWLLAIAVACLLAESVLALRWAPAEAGVRRAAA